MPYTDIAKRREAHKRYYYKNVQMYIEKNARRKKELLKFVISLKNMPCKDCGISYPHYVMDFDHLDSNKKIASVSRMATMHMYSKAKILKEIEKCDLVCSNCHRVRTYKRKHYPIG